MESLSRDVNRQQRAVTIMHGSAGGGPNYVMYVAGVGAVSAVYFKFVCGWRLTDMLYVTRGHLRKGMQEVNEGGHLLLGRIAWPRETGLVSGCPPLLTCCIVKSMACLLFKCMLKLDVEARLLSARCCAHDVQEVSGI